MRFLFSLTISTFSSTKIIYSAEETIYILLHTHTHTHTHTRARARARALILFFKNVFPFSQHQFNFMWRISRKKKNSRKRCVNRKPYGNTTYIYVKYIYYFKFKNIFAFSSFARFRQFKFFSFHSNKQF